MNKLLFTLEVDFGDDIKLIANNHKDLEDYINKNYDWYMFEVRDNLVRIQTREGFDVEFGKLEWIKHV
jgi:hypothetical protein